MFLWIDPWIRKLWYALIDDACKVVDAGILLQDQKAPTRHDQFDRLYNIYSFFLDIFTTYPIKQVAIEKLFFTAWNQANAEFVYGVRWALIALAYEHNAWVLEYAPVELKKAITGNWHAGKPLIQSTIMKLLKMQSLPIYADAADALWLAYLAWKKKQ
jgi:crossover junction endodeoxyribonuclease RuvC